jgi:hypothetical protein
MTNPQRPSSYQRTTRTDSNDVDIQGGVEKIDTAAVAAAVSSGATLGGIEIDTDRVIRTDDIDREAFMRDELEVFFNEAQNENDPAFVEVNVNGDYRLAVRGETCKLRRYHVAILAQAKQSRVRQKKIVQADGSMGFQEEQVLSLTYPFSVISDPRPQKGGAWLRQLLSNPV